MAWLNGRTLLASVGAAMLIEGVLVIVTNVITGPDGAMGTPVPISHIRRGAVSSILEGSPAPAPSQVLVAWLTFALDVAITAVPIYAVAVRWGAFATPLAALAGLVAALGIAWVMSALRLPFIGLPIPIARPPVDELSSLALWADCLLLGGLFLLLTRVVTSAPPT